MKNTYLLYLIKQYSHIGVYLDANVLILLITGRFNNNYVGTVNRTSAFSVADYLILENLLDKFNKLYTTPHIVTEVSNLISLKGEKLIEFNTFLCDFITHLTETFTESKILCKSNGFNQLGLADTALIESSNNNFLVITADLALCNYLESTNRNVINFNHLRSV